MFETKESYYAYLETSEWRAKRAERIRIDGGICKICGDTNDLQVHHITYDNVRNEDIERDLITLCRKCHKRIHKQADDNKAKIEENVSDLLDELREVIKPTNVKYIEKQSDLVANILAEYNDNEWRNVQTITRLLRNLVRIDWPDVVHFEGAMRYGGKQLHSTAIQKAAKKRRGLKNGERP